MVAFTAVTILCLILPFLHDIRYSKNHESEGIWCLGSSRLLVHIEHVATKPAEMHRETWQTLNGKFPWIGSMWGGNLMNRFLPKQNRIFYLGGGP